jgi:hypothetical protein
MTQGINIIDLCNEAKEDKNHYSSDDYRHFLNGFTLIMIRNGTLTFIVILKKDYRVRY